MHGGFFVGIRVLAAPVDEALQPSVIPLTRARASWNRPESAHIPAYPMHFGH